MRTMLSEAPSEDATRGTAHVESRHARISGPSRQALRRSWVADAGSRAIAFAPQAARASLRILHRQQRRTQTQFSRHLRRFRKGDRCGTKIRRDRLRQPGYGVAPGRVQAPDISTRLSRAVLAGALFAARYISVRSGRQCRDFLFWVRT